MRSKSTAASIFRSKCSAGTSWSITTNSTRSRSRFPRSSIFHHPESFYHINAKKPSWAGLFRHAEAGAQRVPAFCAVCRQVLERKGVHAARRSPFRLPKSWSTSLAPKTPHSSSSRSCRSLQRDGHLLFLVQHPPQSRAAHAKLDRRLTLIAVDAAQGNLYQFAGHLLQRTICVKHRSLGRRLRGL